MSTNQGAVGKAQAARERRALVLLAGCIGDVLGVRSEAYRNLLRASASENPLDQHLARLSFEALDADVRTEIWRRVQSIGAHTPARDAPVTAGVDEPAGDRTDPGKRRR